jgi:hypothetical protein
MVIFIFANVKIAHLNDNLETSYCADYTSDNMPPPCKKLAEEIQKYNTSPSFSPTDNSTSSTIYVEEAENISDTEKLIEKKCNWDDGNVGRTECIIEMLDRVAVEREWKQRKLEAIKYGEINPYEVSSDLVGNWEKHISNWRKNFEDLRDARCNSKLGLLVGSGIPSAIAECQIEFEVLAISDLNELYYETIIKDTHSSGITDFEPTDAEIGALIKTNKTERGCIWFGDEECSIK